MRQAIQYGILDCDGQVVRWVWEKPSVPHITRKEPRYRKPKFDLSTLPDAPF
jgi:hypothetical protein